MTRHLALPLAFVAAAACTAPEGRDPAAGWTGIEANAESEDDGSDVDDGGAILDVGAGGSDQVQGCRAIDFLFVIDNSRSMAAQQQRLLASFPGFMATIQAALGDVESYHVGVVTSDAYQFNSAGCTGLGDLVTKTGGADSSGADCAPFAEGERFATDVDDLTSMFPCIAKVGTDGAGEERPISALVSALHPANAEPGACNEGFLRDDAILVVVIVTDDPPFVGDRDDAHLDMGQIGAWHNAVVTAKNGDEAAAVVIGFVPTGDLSCLVYPVASPNMVDFVESFGDQGELQSVCEADYSGVFAQTVSTIQSTCSDFTPPG